jgi:hypothetical protein
MRGLTFFLLVAVIPCAGQSNPEQQPAPQNPTAEAQETVTVGNGTTAGMQNPQPTALKQITIPAGTEVPLLLKSAIDTKNTRVGDGVYCQTSFPVVIDNTIVIPAGTYVKGEVVKAERAGRIKGRAQVLFKFNTLIFPNGYTVEIPGTIHHDSGSPNSSVDEEGKITADPQKGKDAGTIAKGTGIGAAGGAIATGSRTGVLGGAGIGMVAALATVFATRGQDVRIEPGTSLKMLLQRPLTVDVVPLNPRRFATEVVPHSDGSTRLAAPSGSHGNPK